MPLKRDACGVIPSDRNPVLFFSQNKPLLCKILLMDFSIVNLKFSIIINQILHVFRAFTIICTALETFILVNDVITLKKKYY